METTSSKKRTLGTSENEETPKNKKKNLFSMKEFRKQLLSSEKLAAINKFGDLLNDDQHDYIFDYLDNGGSVLELLQTLENDSQISSTVIFNIIAQILFKIKATYIQFFKPSYEACKYLMNNYLTLINKMIGISSSKTERKTCLKLLTAMVTLSSNLAKDVLLNVKFNPVNLQLFNTSSIENKSVRNSFVHFLTAFLINMDPQTFPVFLERSRLLTSIIPGLQYDSVDTLCLIINAMKNHILENPAVMKTTKMHIFNTIVVRNIVSLHNWKGPNGLKMIEKNYKGTFEPDTEGIAKVRECIHAFLLVLCSSYKFGVVFKDPLVGLGRKNQNSLMYTVLESLDSPWEHHYPRELVLRICISCPDLIKNVWNMLKPYLNPCLSDKWLKAANFTIDLLNEIKPEVIQHSINYLSSRQLAQLIQILVSPFGILNVLLSENDESESNASNEVKMKILIIIFTMLKQIDDHLCYLKNLMNYESWKQVKTMMSNYIEKNYPSGEKLFTDWNICKEKIATVQYMSHITDIINMYQILAPDLLSDLNSSNIDLDRLFADISTESDNVTNSILQRKIFKVFIDIDPSKFVPKKSLFAYGITKFLKLYYQEKDEETLHVLQSLLKNTGIFDNCSIEINTWINAIFNLDSLSNEFIQTYLNLLIEGNINLFEYQKILCEFNVRETSSNKSNIIEFLLNIDSGSLMKSPRIIRHNNNLSCLIIVLLKQNNLSGKHMRQFMEYVLLNLFHAQPNLNKFLTLIKNENFTSIIPSNILAYIENWSDGNCVTIKKFEGCLQLFPSVSNSFLQGAANESQDRVYPYFYVDILRTFTFYFSNLIHYGLVLPNHSSNWLSSIDYLIKHNLLDDNCLELILENSKLIKHFKITSYEQQDSPKGICTKTILNLVKMLKESNHKDIQRYLTVYINRIFNSIMKIIKIPHAYVNCSGIEEFLYCFDLSKNQLTKLIEQIVTLFDSNKLIEFPIIFEILISCVHGILSDDTLLTVDVIFKLTSYVVDLATKNNKISNLAKVLNDYFHIHPNSIVDIHPNLFSSMLQTSTYNKDYAELIVFLLEKNQEKFTPDVTANIALIAEKKGLILSVADVLIHLNAPDDVLKILYENLENSILKAIEKPQKTGQHFRKTSELSKLLEKFFPIDKCKTLINKVQKFEVIEIFHVKLLEVCFNKIITTIEIDSKQISNILLTFIHLQMPILKKDEYSEEMLIKLNDITRIFNGIIGKIIAKYHENSLNQLANNETFKTFIQLILNHGISGHEILLEMLISLLKITPIDVEVARSLFDLLQNHSEFSNAILGEHNARKFNVLSLFALICEKWPEFIEKNHVAIVLAAFNGTITKCDGVCLRLLELFERKQEQSYFYDFMPFIWGRTAAIDYSIRNRIKNPLFKRPKISDVLGILNEDLVNYTITNYPLLQTCRKTEIIETKCYDMTFFLPLFSHLMAPEQQIKYYMFTRSGALSLTIICLCNPSLQIRQGAGHVMHRFYCHLETNQFGKDNLVCMRFIQVLCGGLSNLRGHKLNTFAAIFFARMALILTNPKHVMYLPLASYLASKPKLDLSVIPELYTLFFSSHVNFKEHRLFILQILRDGLVTADDFFDFIKSMSFKLICELYSSRLSDLDSREIILEIFLSASYVPMAVDVLCRHYSLLSLLYNWMLISKETEDILITIIIKIVSQIETIRNDEYTCRLIKKIKYLVNVDHDNIQSIRYE